MRRERTEPQRDGERERARIVGAVAARGTDAADSTFRALQALPLARIASSGDEHAPVRTVAILGYN